MLHQTIKEIEKEFDKQKLGDLDFCGNEDHECACSVKVSEIKSFIKSSHIALIQNQIERLKSKISVTRDMRSTWNNELLEQEISYLQSEIEIIEKI